MDSIKRDLADDEGELIVENDCGNELYTADDVGLYTSITIYAHESAF